VRNIFKEEYFIKNSLVFEKKKGGKKRIKNQQKSPKSPFCRNILEKEYFIKILLFLKKKKKGQKKNYKSTKIPQIAIL
jgi:hypothetical protein